MAHSGNSHFEPGFRRVDPYVSLRKVLSGAWTAADAQDERSAEIAVISHELRNSLAVIRNVARLLRSPPSAGTLETAHALIERHVRHMSRHIDELREPRLRGTRSHEMNCSRVDLRTIVRYSIDAIGPELVRRRHRLTVKLPEVPVWAHADGARLEQVFSNLLINAAKYTPDGGDIGLSMECGDESVCVRIRDSGVGIEPCMLSRVFGMFVQVNTSTPARENGSGIGLAVVRTVVEQHGGSVTAASAGLGLGAEFSVVLPTLLAQKHPVIVMA